MINVFIFIFITHIRICSDECDHLRVVYMNVYLYIHMSIYLFINCFVEGLGYTFFYYSFNVTLDKVR
jgi:hypothetical protein